MQRACDFGQKFRHVQSVALFWVSVFCLLKVEKGKEVTIANRKFWFRDGARGKMV